MHGERERVGACKDGIETIVTIIFTECFLNTVAYIPTVHSCISYFVQGKRCGLCWENDEIKNWEEI